MNTNVLLSKIKNIANDVINNTLNKVIPLICLHIVTSRIFIIQSQYGFNMPFEATSYRKFFSLVKHL